MVNLTEKDTEKNDNVCFDYKLSLATSMNVMLQNDIQTQVNVTQVPQVILNRLKDGYKKSTN